MAPSRSTSRGRSRSKSQTSTTARRTPSPTQQDSRSPRRPQSLSRSPDPRDSRNGLADRGRSRTRSRSPSRDRRRSYRERSYSRGRSHSRRHSHSRSRSRSHSQSRGINPQSSKIVVEKLTKNVTEAHLQEIFGSYGRIQSIDLPMNRQFMTNRGTAYIVYENAAGSESAIAHMHEAQLDGSAITVSIVLPRRAFSRSPPATKDARPLPLTSRYNQPRGTPLSRHRSPPARRGGGYNGRAVDWDDPRRNGRDYTRSPSLPRRRERSDSYSRSPSRTPPRRRGPPPRSPPRRRRRSPSYSSSSTYSRSKSRTPSRTPSRTRHSHSTSNRR